MKAEILEIRVEMQRFRYKPGQWLYLNLPRASRQQWHPFTITSCPFDPYISLHVRQVGEFTHALRGAFGADQALERIPIEDQRMPEIRIDGPYGSAAEDVLEHRVAVLIGMGIGVTPWAAILRYIWYMYQKRAGLGRLRRVEFVWVYSDPSSVEWLQPLLCSLETDQVARGTGRGLVRIHTYLTQKLGSDSTQNIVLNSAAVRDPLTELRARTNFGRPDFDRLLSAVRDDALDGIHGGEGVKTDVGVFFCGKKTQLKTILN